MNPERLEHFKSLQKTHKRRRFPLAHPLMSLHPPYKSMASGDPLEMAQAYERSRAVIAERVKNGEPVMPILLGNDNSDTVIADLSAEAASSGEQNG